MNIKSDITPDDNLLEIVFDQEHGHKGRRKIRKSQDVEESEMLVADGLDEAILGVAYRAGSDPVMAYDISKVIKILMERDGMSREEAVEFYEFNIEQAYMGNRTPCWINTERLGEET